MIDNEEMYDTTVEYNINDWTMQEKLRCFVELQ